MFQFLNTDLNIPINAKYEFIIYVHFNDPLIFIKFKFLSRIIIVKCDLKLSIRERIGEKTSEIQNMAFIISLFTNLRFSLGKKLLCVNMATHIWQNNHNL